MDNCLPVKRQTPAGIGAQRELLWESYLRILPASVPGKPSLWPFLYRNVRRVLCILRGLYKWRKIKKRREKTGGLQAEYVG